MKRFFKKFVCLVFIFISITLISFSTLTSVNAQENTVYLGGIPAGFCLNTRGALVVGLCDVVTTDKIYSPAKDADIKVGDLILSIDDNEVNNAQDIEKYLVKKTSIINVKRGNETIIKTIAPAKDDNNKYKLGVFIKDGVSGIGTITYFTKNRYGALGHPVLSDTFSLLEITGGEIYKCKITGCVKGERGKAGELRGIIVRENQIAKIDKNLFSGVYGQINDGYLYENNLEEISLGQAKPGKATIYTTIEDDKPSHYDISIVKVQNLGESKNFVIKINDKKLLKTTGGIVQGMSGSPIIQDGHLVGAVTHVFINDPTRGFGIAIENMINN